MAGLIELVGQVALKDAGNVTIDFLDGCTDSNNGNGTEILAPRDVAQPKALSYCGSYSNDSVTLSNE
ncbi:Catalase/peroxidase HPI [Phytophthora cinnamomi]|uniref:Catalase/peroxidase HPI n=1 Tax=Phytophthora cinnamomi TaxID=4785 RepID=UPI0035598740|nr:Catalase/peroxidase HPI [Phytophthora cinnamomi]